MISPASYILESDASIYASAATLLAGGATYVVLEVRALRDVIDMYLRFNRISNKTTVSSRLKQRMRVNELACLEETIKVTNLPISGLLGNLPLLQLEKKASHAINQ